MKGVPRGLSSSRKPRMAPPPSMAALSLCGSQSSEVRPKPTSPDTSAHPPKKQPVIELESRWPPAAPPPQGLLWDLQRDRSESRGGNKTYTHAYCIFLFPPWPHIHAPQGAPLKQEWGCRRGAHRNPQAPTIPGRAPDRVQSTVWQGQPPLNKGVVPRATSVGAGSLRESFKDRGNSCRILTVPLLKS